MSIHNVHDIDFLLKDIKIKYDSWIGLTTDRQDGWEWSDDTAVQVQQIINKKTDRIITVFTFST